MLAALLTTLLFATSAICGYRTAKQVGGVEANFWRITLATIFLTVWAFTFGHGFAGAPEWFMLSGLFGIGLGDSAYFQALPRLGSRRTVLLCQCLTAPFAALIEWLWLGTKLNLPEILCIAVILAGVAIALAPGDHLKISARDWKIGIALISGLSAKEVIVSTLGTVYSIGHGSNGTQALKTAIRRDPVFRPLPSAGIRTHLQQLGREVPPRDALVARRAFRPVGPAAAPRAQPEDHLQSGQA